MMADRGDSAVLAVLGKVCSDSLPTELPGIGWNGSSEAVRGTLHLGPHFGVSPGLPCQVRYDVESPPIAPRAEPTTPSSTALAPLNHNDSAEFGDLQVLPAASPVKAPFHPIDAWYRW